MKFYHFIGALPSTYYFAIVELFHFQVTVQGVVDPRGVFTDVCTGWPGSINDDQVLEKSALYQRANVGLLNGVWVVGSWGYPLMDWVLIPYRQQRLTWTQYGSTKRLGRFKGLLRKLLGD